MGKKSTESFAASSPTWGTLEAFARQSMQQLLQRMLEEEVDGVLARGRYERRAVVDAVAGYRNGFGKPRLDSWDAPGLSDAEPASTPRAVPPRRDFVGDSRTPRAARLGLHAS